VDLLVIALVAVWFTRGWWREGLPIGDFQGIAGWSWYLWTSLQESGRVPAWSPYWFNGGTFLTFWAPLSCFLSLPFVELMGLVGGFKFLWVGSVVLSGWLMYGVAHSVLRDHDAALVAATVYAVHPFHLAEVAFYSHTEAIIEFVAMPALFWCYWQTLEKPHLRWWLVATTLLLAGTLLAIGAEFTVILGLGLVALFAWYTGGRLASGWREGRVPWKQVAGGLGRSVAIVLAALGIAAFWLLPLWQEVPHAAFISPDESLRFALRASMDNPVFPLDRAGHFLRRTAPERVMTDAYGLPEQEAGLYIGSYYLGVIAAALAILPWALRRRDGWGIGGFCWVIVVGGLWMAMGSYSLYAITLNPHSRLRWLWSRYFGVGDKALLIAIAALVLAAVGMGIWRRWGERLRRPRTLLLILGALAVVAPLILWIKPLMLLGKMMPGLSHMRVPLRFYLLVVPALALLAGCGVVALRRTLRPLAFRAVWIVALVLVLLDFAPYARFFDLQWPLEDIQETYAPFAADEGTYTLGSVYANGVLGDFGMTMAQKPIVWGWLEWAAPRGRRGFVHGLAALGWDALEESAGAEDLANLLAVSNARYLIHPWLPDADYVRHLAGTPYFHLVRTGERFAVLENLSPAQYVQLYGDAALYWDTRSSPDELPREERLARLVARAAPRGVAVVEALSAEAPRPYRFVAVDEWVATAPADLPRLALSEDGGAIRREADRLVPEPVPIPARQTAWERTSPEEIRVRVGPGVPCLLTVAESWHPRWQVYRDGQPVGAPVRVNGGFQGVWLDDQDHELVFRFEPGPAASWGWAVTGLTLLAGAAWLAWGWRRR